MALRSVGIGVDNEGGGAPSETVCCVRCQALRHGRGLGAESAATQAGEANCYFFKSGLAHLKVFVRACARGNLNTRRKHMSCGTKV